LPDLLPFRGLRYTGTNDLSTVTAPPYDVIDEHERGLLEDTHPHNSVRLILPRHDDDIDGYQTAASDLARWRAEGILAVDADPHLYAYRMTYDVADGSSRQTLGVIGALALAGRGDTGDVLPHERTLPKARSDRFALLEATRANFDPIWGLSLADGLTEAIGAPEIVMQASDREGTLHELGLLDETSCDSVRELVAGAPIVIADGHHRFETARKYHAEHPDDTVVAAIMMMVVELSDDQLCVRPIHRLVHGTTDLRARIDDAFAVETLESGPDAAQRITSRMDAEHALGLVDREGFALLHPRADRIAARLADVPSVLRDVDSVRFDVAIRPVLGGAELSYRDDSVTVAALVEKGEADAAVLLRPVTVAEIRAAAFARARMPEKTTFFAPKPRTGMVFRAFDA
jgi:uncharacterized protein (DUF1015 family)